MGLTSRPLRLFSCWPASWRSGSGSGASGAARLVATRIAATRSLGRTRPRSRCAGRLSLRRAAAARSKASRKRDRRRRGSAGRIKVTLEVGGVRVALRPRPRAGLREASRVRELEVALGSAARSPCKFEPGRSNCQQRRGIRGLGRRRLRSTGACGPRRARRGARGAREADEAERRGGDVVHAGAARQRTETRGGPPTLRI